MNIESILEKINLFNELVINSGLKRDVRDYQVSIQVTQNRNLTFMKDISEKLKKSLTIIENNSVPHELKIILKDTTSFCELNTLEKLITIDMDNEIDANTYFTQFNAILTELIREITANENEIDTIEAIFSKYITGSDSYERKEEQALLSLIFKDLKSTGTLKEFSKVLQRWSKVLLMYHTLLKSESPNEVSLVEIQNGSIDVVLNIDIDVAIDLTELFKVGFMAYSSYLVYKSELAKELVASYCGHKKLIASELQREKYLLDNIKESIQVKMQEQHKFSIKEDKKIEQAGIKNKIEETSSLITDHIIKGNEIKLLSVIEEGELEDDDENPKDIRIELREITSLVRKRYKSLNPNDKQILLDRYELKDESE